jgi:hypothetical protein
LGPGLKFPLVAAEVRTKDPIDRGPGVWWVGGGVHTEAAANSFGAEAGKILRRQDALHFPPGDRAPREDVTGLDSFGGYGQYPGNIDENGCAVNEEQNQLGHGKEQADKVPAIAHKREQKRNKNDCRSGNVNNGLEEVRSPKSLRLICKRHIHALSQQRRERRRRFSGLRASPTVRLHVLDIDVDASVSYTDGLRRRLPWG